MGFFHLPSSFQIAVRAATALHWFKLRKFGERSEIERTDICSLQSIELRALKRRLFETL